MARREKELLKRIMFDVKMWHKSGKIERTFICAVSMDKAKIAAIDLKRIFRLQRIILHNRRNVIITN